MKYARAPLNWFPTNFPARFATLVTMGDICISWDGNRSEVKLRHLHRVNEGQARLSSNWLPTV